MDFEWDEGKSALNLERHGILFRAASEIFLDPQRIEQRSDRQGETRWITTGLIEGEVWSVVFTTRGRAIRIISARRARNDEKEGYYRSIHERGDPAD